MVCILSILGVPWGGLITIFGTWVYHHETMCSIHSWFRYELELWPKGQIYRVFDMFSCPAHNLFLIWHWLTIFGTCVYHHEKMWRVHPCSWFDVQASTFLSFDIPGSHTLLCTWVYHHGMMYHIDSRTQYDLDLWPQYQNLYFHHGFESGKMFLFFDKGILNFGTWVYHHETICCVHSWP